MERAVIWSIVGVVIIVGLISILSTGTATVTGSVVERGCECIATSPVCGAIEGELQDYPSGCHAICAGANIVYDDKCVKIPRS